MPPGQDQLEDDVVDGQQQQRVRQRPGEAERRALVLDLQVLADEVAQQLPAHPGLGAVAPLELLELGGVTCRIRRTAVPTSRYPRLRVRASAMRTCPFAAGSCVARRPVSCRVGLVRAERSCLPTWCPASAGPDAILVGAARSAAQPAALDGVRLAIGRSAPRVYRHPARPAVVPARRPTWPTASASTSSTRCCSGRCRSRSQAFLVLGERLEQQGRLPVGRDAARVRPAAGGGRAAGPGAQPRRRAGRVETRLPRSTSAPARAAAGRAAGGARSASRSRSSATSAGPTSGSPS